MRLRLRLRGLTSTAFCFRAPFFRRVSTLWLTILLSSSSRNNHIISNRQMTGLKRQKPTAERPRNERGGA
ncbi:hypothetical protein GM893_23465 [Escherichia coli]|nr:hypothetical protein [Escherichia coli]